MSWAEHPTRPTLKLRTSARADASFKTTDCHRHNVEVKEVQGEWCQVKYNGVSGWVRTDYLTPRPASSQSSFMARGVQCQRTRMVRVRHPTHPTLKLRTSARADASFKKTDCHCYEVEVIEVQGEWCQVKYNGVSGRVRTDYLTARPS